MIVLETIHGTGRGKTTNAIGRIFSAFMKKKKIFVIQFLKSGKECGECSFFNAFAETKWFSIGEKGVFYDFKKENKELCRLYWAIPKGCILVSKMIFSNC